MHLFDPLISASGLRTRSALPGYESSAALWSMIPLAANHRAVDGGRRGGEGCGVRVTSAE